MMKNALSNQYQHLSPIERFRLVFAAGERGDDAELARLKGSGQRVEYTASDDFPYTHAFMKLAHISFMDVLEEAAGFRDVLDFVCHVHGEDEVNDEQETEHWKPVMFKGYKFLTKYRGWIRFCKGLGVPPFSLWKGYPGYRRIESTAVLARKMAYKPEGYVRHLSEGKPVSAEEISRCPLTPKVIAKEFRRMYREMVNRG